MKTIEEIIAEIAEQRVDAAKDADEGRHVLCAAMAAGGVATVTIHFTGYGDSGQIDDVEIAMVAGHTEPTDLAEQLEDWAYTFLEGTGVDWQNNDGGYGNITFDLTQGLPEFTAEVYYNETVSHLGFSYPPRSE